jgi:hypothetical protein
MKEPKNTASMKKSVIPAKAGISFVTLLLAILLMTQLTACSGDSKSDPSSSPLTIKGDVSAPVTFDSKDFKDTILTELIAAAKVSGTPKDVYIVAKDGFAVRVGYDEADQITIVCTKETEWSVVAPDMPISTAAKQIAQIIVVSDGSEVGLSVTDKDGKQSVIGMGSILTAPTVTTLHSEGVSEIESGGSVHSSEVFTTEKSVRLKDVYPEYKGEPFALETGNGDKYLTDGDGVFVLNETTIDFRETGGEIYEDVTGITLR